MSEKKPRSRPLSLDEIRANRRTGRPICSLFKFIRDHLTAEDLKVLDAALKDHSIQSSAIYRVLVERGFERGELVVRRHRTDNQPPCPDCASLWLT